MGVRNGNELSQNRKTKGLTSAGTTPATGIMDGFYPSTDSRGSKGANFNFTLSGTFVGTCVVEKTFDGGTTWVQAANKFGTNISMTAPGAHVLQEVEQGVQYRARMSAYTSGTANVRFSQ